MSTASKGLAEVADLYRDMSERLISGASNMDRRHLLGGGVLAGVAAIASPALAQSSPEISWRLTSSFPRSLDTIHYSAEILAKAVAEVTDNRFKIQVFQAGEIVG